MTGLKNGDVFYDELNGRYLTLDGVGCDPKCWSCIVKEYDEDEEDYVMTGRQLFMENELRRMKQMEVIY